MLPEGVIVILEESLLDHLSLISVIQELLYLVGIAHTQSLRLFKRIHEIKLESFASIDNHRVRHWIVFIVEGEAPWSLLTLSL